MRPPPSLVDIHYRRPPDRLQVFEQRIVEASPEVVVTFQPDTPIDRPLEVAGRVVLEPGSPAVWFTFPGRWHDIGRFHTRDGRFTGLYANVLAPVEQSLDGERLRWDTTDLFLDVWLGGDGAPRLLDRDQFERARADGWLDEAVARRALAEATGLLHDHGRRRWPPAVVHAWTLERVRRRLASPRQSDSTT